MGSIAHEGMVRPTGHLHPLRDGPPSPHRDSDHMNTVGEPYSGKPNVRIDEGRPGAAVPNRAPTLPLMRRKPQPSSGSSAVAVLRAMLGWQRRQPAARRAFG